MRTNSNIENMARIIANRVRYHAPILYDDDVDFKMLEEFGLDINLPIFKFEKEMTKPLHKAFALAKKLCNFNLIVTKRTKCPFALFLPTETVNLKLMQMINKLNINYRVISDYNPRFDMDYLKIGGKLLNLQYKDFCLEKNESIKGVLISERQFVCSGECYTIELCNTNSFITEIEIEYNKNLASGMYFFKKEKSSLKVTNLYSKDEKFLNTNLPVDQIYYSCVDGVENSNFACVRFKQTIKLKPYQKKCFFINFGEKKIAIKSKTEMDYLYEVAKLKCYENFDIKIYSIDKEYDEKINTILPRTIWLAWLDGKRNLEKENEYIKEKEKIFVRDKNHIIFNPENHGILREIDVFDGKEFREVYIRNLAKENSLLIGKTSFQNLKSLYLDKIKPKTQICLQFK